MSKPSRSFPRPLSDLLAPTLSGVLKAQGFASAEILSRWPQIVGPEIAASSEPLKINWPRVHGEETPEPATLVLRVEGPAALEAIGRIALRQAPLRRPAAKRRPAPADPAAAARIANALPDIKDDDLRNAIGRLGAAIKRK